jgi:sterol desaturase/sphingolipid hydroxylase (fatty acid hydroxylase superfamily)
MHPVEHFFYYTRVYFPLLFACHPLHFLFSKFQADIGPISGHDGYDDPAGGSAFHYLHHAFFECNYGVPLIDFDRLFGTYKEFVKKPSSNGKNQN